MNRYEVTVFVDGQNVGTYTVKADRVGQAQTRGMLAYLHAKDAGAAPDMRSGAMVTYEVEQKEG